MRIEPQASLRAHNTFGIEAVAKWLAEVRTLDELRALLAEPRLAAEPKLVLGGGSNILLTRDFDGLVIRNRLPGIAVVRQDHEHAWVRAAAGEVWHDLVRFAVERGLGGIENLALIPGQVGAAPMQNIGAYGVELAETCESVEAVDATSGAPLTLTNADCEFGYRDSVFKRRLRGRVVVTAVTLRLARRPRLRLDYGDLRRTLDEMGAAAPDVRAVSAAVVRIRTSKLPDPRTIGNAGSFFKNPVLAGEAFAALAAQHADLPHYAQPDGRIKVPAGWLIERCGWKGRTLGRAGVHDRHALVLVNRGGATGAEVLHLAQEIQRSVKERFGIQLEPEVNLI
jgi:UDP-N-acetylmuramate dehydrogenase